MRRRNIAEDLPIGLKTTSAGRTMGEGECALLNALTWSTGDRYTNGRLAQRSLGLAPATLAAVASGLHSRSVGFNRLRTDYGIRFIAALGLEAWVRRPLLSNDTLQVTSELVKARASKSRRARGVMVFRDVIITQDEQVVAHLDRPMLFERTQESARPPKVPMCDAEPPEQQEDSGAQHLTDGRAHWSLPGIPNGRVYRTRGRTIGEGEFALLTNLTWTIGSLHSNREHMQGTEFGERILVGPIVMAMVISLAERSALIQDLRRLHGMEPASTHGMSAMFHRPVFPGDTLWAETMLIDVRIGPSVRTRLLTFRDIGYNNEHAKVIEITRSVLFESPAIDGAAGSRTRLSHAQGYWTDRFAGG